MLSIMRGDGAVFCGLDPAGVDFDCSSGTAIAQQESPYYAPQAQLEACSVANSGPDIPVHLNHWVQEAACVAWSPWFVRPDGNRVSARAARRPWLEPQ